MSCKFEYRSLLIRDSMIELGLAKLLSRYHHLNHFLLFGYSYERSARSIMERLCNKYGG